MGGRGKMKPEKTGNGEGFNEFLVSEALGGVQKGAGFGTQTNYHHIKYGFYRFKNKPFITYVALQAVVCEGEDGGDQ